MQEATSHFLAVIEYPKKRESDLTNAFTSLDNLSSILVVLFLFVIIKMQSNIFKNIKLADSAITAFRMMIKKHHMPSNEQKKKFLLGLILIYQMLITMIIETTIGIGLVVSEPPNLLDSIDDVYRSRALPIFVKDYYSLDYFKVSI